jgi:GAF domain-containing protein
MQQVKARSLLAAPILFQDQLFGFLAAEGNQPRIWQEEEKSYLRAAAQVVGLTAPLEPMEKVIQQTQLDQAWMSGLTHAIFNEKDFKNTLKQGIDQICKRLKVEQVFVLLYDPDTGKFAVCYQNQTRKANSLGEFLQPLSEMDWQMLEDSSAAIAIENLPEDLRLMAWRQPLLNLGVRSLLVCNTSLGQTLSGVLLVGHEASHIWNSTERRLFQDFSQQLGLILHQWQLQQQKEQQHKIHLVLQQGLTAIQKTRNLERLEQEALQHLNQLLQVPLATLVIWAPGERHGRVVSLPLTNQKFAIKSETRIDIDLDPLIQKALQQVQNGLPVDQGSGLVRLTANELAAETRAWLSGPDIGQILVMPLQATPEHEPFGVVLVADHRERSWSGLQVNASVMLINHLAWAHCSICLTEVLKQRWQALECLNWYKQRRLEDLYRVFAAGSNKLKDLISSKATGSEVHLQRVIGQMQNALALLPNLIKKEFWQLDAQQEPMALATLLKRSLDRLDPLIKQRKLWSQVHNQTNVTLSGDTSKIELVLNELLLLACGRSTPGGRIDIWCHPLDQNWLELSITDDGNIEPQLLLELHHQDQLNLLAPSSLDQPPGQHLKICHTLIQQLGGQMEMLKLEDGRLLSRLKLPLIAEQRRR